MNAKKAKQQRRNGPRLIRMPTPALTDPNEIADWRADTQRNFLAAGPMLDKLQKYAAENDLVWVEAVDDRMIYSITVSGEFAGRTQLWKHGDERIMTAFPTPHYTSLSYSEREKYQERIFDHFLVNRGAMILGDEKPEIVETGYTSYLSRHRCKSGWTTSKQHRSARS